MRLAGFDIFCTTCVDLVTHFCGPRCLLFLRYLIVLYFLLQLGHNLRCDGGIHACRALSRLLLVSSAVLVMVISTPNWRFFLRKSSALASRS